MKKSITCRIARYFLMMLFISVTFVYAQNVGIGTTTPFNKLHVVSSTSVPVLIQSSEPNYTGLYLENTSTGNPILGLIQTGFLRGSLRMDNSNNVILENSASINPLVLSTSGNVGLGNSAPTERLHVAGNLRLNGAFMPNANAGASGQVLISAGAGVAPAWQNFAGTHNHLGETWSGSTNMGLSVVTGNTSFLTTGLSGTVTGVTSAQTIGVHGRSYSSQGIGVWGIAATAGYPVYLGNAGVVGLADNGNGVFGASNSSYCFYGLKQNFASFTGTVAKFENQNAANTAPVLEVVAAGSQPALELKNGFIKVSGSNKTAFTITAVTGIGGNTTGNTITVSYAGISSTDILIVTHNWQGNYVNAVGTYWTGSTWGIFREDNVAMPNGEKFNVLVIKQ